MFIVFYIRGWKFLASSIHINQNPITYTCITIKNNFYINYNFNEDVKYL